MIEVPERVSNPRSVPASYSRSAPAASRTYAKIIGPDGESWLSRFGVADALAGAARRAGRPLAADQLVAFAAIPRWVPHDVLAAILAELVEDVRLVVEWRQVTLFERVKVYAAPADGGRP